MISKVRKAVIAGLGAGVAAGVGALMRSGSMTSEDISNAIGVGVAAAVAIGWATWRVPNA